jgi:hypothetical protein
MEGPIARSPLGGEGVPRGSGGQPQMSLSGRLVSLPYCILVRLLTTCAVSVVALAVAGCGGSGSESSTRDDVLYVLRAPPTRPSGSWENTGTRQISFAELRSTLEAQGGHEGIADALADAGFERSYVQHWTLSSAGDSTAEVRASVFQDAAGAHKGFAPLQKLVPSWFVPIPLDGLGEEAVAGKSDAVAAHLWRRANLVLTVYVTRGPGHTFDVVAAARTVAQEIDERAKAR